MKDKAFVDTNIFIYLYSSDEMDKRNICVETLQKFNCFTSTQALNELSNVFTRKWKLSSQQIKEVITEISSFCEIKLVDLNTIDCALDIHSRYSFSYFDSLMLSSALLNQCKYILTEDMKDKQKIDGLTICNIFKETM